MGLSQANSELRKDTVAVEVVWGVVARVTASTHFQKAPRASEVFRYLCERALTHPAGTITEHQIGVAIFGWDANQYPESDSIVRVQVSQVRKKLEHYFVAEGAREPVTISIPRGSYVPVFTPQKSLEVMAEPPVPQTIFPVSAPSLRHLSWGVALLALAAIVAAVFFWHRPTANSATPALDRFWAGFSAGSSTEVVLSDGNLIAFAEMLGRSVTLAEYLQPDYPRRLIDSSFEPGSYQNKVADAILGSRMTGMQDAKTLASLTQWLQRRQVSTFAVSARGFRMQGTDNAIILGHPKGNPWIDFFADRLAFQYQFDYATRRGMLLNRHPQAGEQTSYSTVGNREFYCVVAVLPKPSSSARVILIYGSDMPSLEVGGRFVVDETEMEQFYRQLGKQTSKPSPYVQILLKATKTDTFAPYVEVVAIR